MGNATGLPGITHIHFHLDMHAAIPPSIFYLPCCYIVAWSTCETQSSVEWPRRIEQQVTIH